jgi:hypothetical protein
LIYLNAEPRRTACIRVFAAGSDKEDDQFGRRDEINMDWKPIDTAPFGPDVELAIIDRDGEHTLAFPCQRFVGGWMNAKTKKELSVLPTHWRIWTP